ncbi:MAG: CIA30 family protein [Pseudomonadota bacterium]
MPAHDLTRRTFLAATAATSIVPAQVLATRAEMTMIADFTDGAAPDWRYVSDRVMGGVSDGAMQMARQGDARFARLSGTVSTANNGGFIQMRRGLDAPFATDTSGLRLRVRGNGAKYYVHLRPRSSRRPWHYFAAMFDAPTDWQEISLPWSAFTAQGGLVAEFDPTQITSIGVVAYGADYEAELDVAWIAVEQQTS